MDQVIVLSEGNISECGTFDELLRQRGTFAGMAARQGIFPKAEGGSVEPAFSPR